MTTTLNKKDFETSNDVRWCPGCGDYSILAALQRFVPTLGIPKEQFVFVSGIGCSSRFPYYMNTYGFHTIHGRAPTIASGVKLANPDLSVWIITGDGDALSIGGNHLLHLLRRNLDVNLLLFNNQIYGLTKGQYSPTSEIGKVTKSSPIGSVDHPINPLLFALGSQATFVARTVDVDVKHMKDVLTKAVEHKGTSFVEIYQNCLIFNDKAFSHVAERGVREQNQLILEDGELLIFGKEKNKGICLDGLKPRIVEFSPGDLKAAEDAGVLRYDSSDFALASIISTIAYPQFPVPLGVVYRQQRAVFEELVQAQITNAKEKRPPESTDRETIEAMFNSGNTWEVA